MNARKVIEDFLMLPTAGINSQTGEQLWNIHESDNEVLLTFDNPEKNQFAFWRETGTTPTEEKWKNILETILISGLKIQIKENRETYKKEL